MLRVLKASELKRSKIETSNTFYVSPLTDITCSLDGKLFDRRQSSEALLTGSCSEVNQITHQIKSLGQDYRLDR